MHGIFDDALFAFILILPIIGWKRTWPQYLKRLKTGAPGVRIRYYRRLMVGQWIVAACLLSYWALKARPWNWLMLAGKTTPFDTGIPTEWRLWGGLTYVALLIGILAAKRRAFLARSDRMERVRQKLAYVEPLLPHTATERRLFWLVSLTAGTVEELLFRGFLFWFLSAWMGSLSAVLVSSAIFGASHVYIGIAHAAKTSLLGLLLAMVALISASLWPAMLLHAALDWNSGELGFRMFEAKASTPGGQ
jgi:hypothetical protein